MINLTFYGSSDIWSQALHLPTMIYLSNHMMDATIWRHAMSTCDAYIGNPLNHFSNYCHSYASSGVHSIVVIYYYVILHRLKGRCWAYCWQVEWPSVAG